METGMSDIVSPTSVPAKILQLLKRHKYRRFPDFAQRTAVVYKAAFRSIVVRIIDRV